MIKLDTALVARDLRIVPAAARAAEEAGFDAVWTLETGDDPYLPLVMAAEHTARVRMGTAIAVAFPRSPMVTAQIAWDLAGFSRGRFILGLGTQVKGHNERRYSVKWEAPVARLREYVESLRAIFQCWATGGTQLAYHGKFYNFSLMTPFFTPAPHQFSDIPIYLAGVNEKVIQLGGELCQGLHAHPFHSPKYLREFVLPNLEIGLEKSGRTRKDFAIASIAFVITGKNRVEIDRMREEVRRQIAFYASTRTYRVVLDTHGWGEVATRLNQRAAKGDWDGMASEISDEMVDTYSVSGTFDQIGERVKARYEGLLDRIAFYMPYRAGTDDDAWRKLNSDFNS
ncbi:MAG TPA: TIGR03617 family F420-dependent LLM class oxidoreductase [Candidatus Binataceae bacterium]|nr:TIGR03617 family F420-dependent LLM class oxidoreductase [Candidatus Binataceae bacterium]